MIQFVSSKGSTCLKCRLKTDKENCDDKWCDVLLVSGSNLDIFGK